VKRLRFLYLTPVLATVVCLAVLSPAAHSEAPGAAPGERGQPAHDAAAPLGRCRVCQLAHRFNLRMTPLVRPSFTRCSLPERAVTAVRPRGRIRSDDLSHVRVDVGDSREVDPLLRREQDGTETILLSWRLGNTRLGSLRVPADAYPRTTATTARLRRGLRGVRGRITWGRFDVKEPSATGSFWLDPPSAAETSRARRLDLALVEAPLWIRQLLRAQLLLDQGFAQAALDEASVALAAHPDEPHAAALVEAAHQRLGLMDLPEVQQHAVQTSKVWARRTYRPWTRRTTLDSPLCDLDRPLTEEERKQRRFYGCGG
jgi:hypothetical protein